MTHTHTHTLPHDHAQTVCMDTCIIIHFCITHFLPLFPLFFRVFADLLCRAELNPLISAAEAAVFFFRPRFLPPKPNFLSCSNAQRISKIAGLFSCGCELTLNCLFFDLPPASRGFFTTHFSWSPSLAALTANSSSSFSAPLPRSRKTSDFSFRPGNNSLLTTPHGYLRHLFCCISS